MEEDHVWDLLNGDQNAGKNLHAHHPFIKED